MVRKRMVSTVMSLMMAAAVLTTVPVTNNVKAADKEITSGDYTYVKKAMERLPMQCLQAIEEVRQISSSRRTGWITGKSNFTGI